MLECSFLEVSVALAWPRKLNCTAIKTKGFVPPLRRCLCNDPLKKYSHNYPCDNIPMVVQFHGSLSKGG